MSLPVESLPVPSSISDGGATLTLPVESLPPVESLSSISDGDVTLTFPVESLPPIESQPTLTAPITGSITPQHLPSPISETTDPPMSIPQGETPVSTGATSSSSGSASASASRSGPPEQTTAAAPPSLKGDNTTFMLALGVSGVSIFVGAVWTLL